MFSNDSEDLYSNVINPENYNRIISKEHLYISTSDEYIKDTIKAQASSQKEMEVVELGCGPARILTLMSKINNINLTGIDSDIQFFEYAKKITKGTSIEIKLADLETYHHLNPVSIFYSQGVHHHISKGQKTSNYLQNIYSQLAPNGIYILSDEFIADYNTEEEREVRLVIWYSHVIDHALKNGYQFLAQEEAKTLLDDLQEGKNVKDYKSVEKISLILKKVRSINKNAMNKNMNIAEQYARELIKDLNSKKNSTPSGDNSLDLSRRDYKICNKMFEKEIQNTPFIIESVKYFGPTELIGGMNVYILKKR